MFFYHSWLSPQSWWDLLRYHPKWGRIVNYCKLGTDLVWDIELHRCHLRCRKILNYATWSKLVLIKYSQCQEANWGGNEENCHCAHKLLPWQWDLHIKHFLPQNCLGLSMTKYARTESYYIEPRVKNLEKKYESMR